MHAGLSETQQRLPLNLYSVRLTCKKDAPPRPFLYRHARACHFSLFLNLIAALELNFQLIVARGTRPTPRNRREIQLLSDCARASSLTLICRGYWPYSTSCKRGSPSPPPPPHRTPHVLRLLIMACALSSSLLITCVIAVTSKFTRRRNSML
jgi:hypothetical protein